MIPPAFVQDLLARVDIVDVVGRHVQLKKSGANLSGLCPFHAEKSPSFTVSPSKQFYHCFGCGVSGDAIRFLSEYTGAAFRDAVEELAQQVGMKVPDEDKSPLERERASAAKQQRESLSDVLRKAAEFYRGQLRATPRAIDYLKRRGVTGEIAAEFAIGYAPDGWRGLANAFPRYDDQLLEECGLVITHAAETAEGAGSAQSKRYDRFRDRIMFPIRSVKGDVIGFGGRVLDRGEPKYLNSPETTLFSKGRELYGLFEARQALRERGYALVVEGYMDVVALAQAGFANAVATLGTACTADHVQKLFRFTESVVFSFDGDAAGRRAALRAMETSLPYAEATRSIKFLFLPVEHDPDTFVRQFGAAEFERCVSTSVPLSRQLVEAASVECELETAEGRARFLAQAQPYWSALPEGPLKLQIFGEIASQARLETTELHGLWQSSLQRSSPREFAATTTTKPAQAASRRLSRGTANLLDRALWLLLNRCDLWTGIEGEAHDLLAGQAPPYDALFGGFEKVLLDHGNLSCNALVQELRTLLGPGAGTDALGRILELHEPDPAMDFPRELRLVIDRMRLHMIEEELKQLFESGQLSAQSQERGRQLMSTQSRLKAQFAAIRTDL
jgi:DNA primase